VIGRFINGIRISKQDKPAWERIRLSLMYDDLSQAQIGCIRTDEYIRYTYFLSKKLEGTIELELEHAQKTFIPDKEMRQIVKDMIIEKYQTADIRQVGINERLQIARTLKFKYACTVKQICRMVHIEKDTIEGFL
jgi:hypothetical protein